MLDKFLNYELVVQVHSQAEKQALIDIFVDLGYPQHPDVSADSYKTFPTAFFDQNTRAVNFNSGGFNGRNNTFLGMQIVQFQDFANEIEGSCVPELDLTALF